jgi:RIO-like serine/threonine protein kinase
MRKVHEFEDKYEDTIEVDVGVGKDSQAVYVTFTDLEDGRNVCMEFDKSNIEDFKKIIEALEGLQ